MKEQQDYLKDISEIRYMMEKSSKFLSLSGWAGIMAGIYALIATYISYTVYNFNPDSITYTSPYLTEIFIIGILVLFFALATAIILSINKAHKRGDIVWNAASKQLLINMFIPLAVGGILILIFISYMLIGLLAPFSLLFYGLALYNTSKFTYNEVKYLGLIQIMLGLLSSYFIEYILFFWAFGFGILHIIYGIYLYFRYEK